MITLNTSRILVPYDFSTTSDRALKHAALLAKRNGGELLLLYVRRNSALVGLGRSQAELRLLAEESHGYKKMMEGTAKNIRDEFGIPVRVLVGLGNRISGILKACDKNNAGLIVMGTNGSDSVSNIFSGSNSQKVVSRSHIPVITVRVDSQKQGYQHILVPVDLSEHTRQKIVVAIQMAKLFSAKLHLLGLVESNVKNSADKLKAIIKQIEKRLKDEEVEYTSETIQTNDSANRTLLAARRNHADMIVTMTDEGKTSSFFKNHSFDNELVEESRIPVLSVPPQIDEDNIKPSMGGLW